MILIGQYDSPFVRRVGIALTLYGLAFEHKPWSTFGDADKIRPYNPLTRVPTLVLDDGEVLIDLHHHPRLSRRPRAGREADVSRRGAGTPPGAESRDAGVHTAEKAVSLFYEKVLHKEASDVWTKRCRTQISGALAALEPDRAARKTDYWFGDQHRTCRYRGRGRAALHRRRASGDRRDGGFSGAERACEALRGAAGVPGDQPGVHPTGVIRTSRTSDTPPAGPCRPKSRCGSGSRCPWRLRPRRRSRRRARAAG